MTYVTTKQIRKNQPTTKGSPVYAYMHIGMAASMTSTPFQHSSRRIEKPRSAAFTVNSNEIKAQNKAQKRQGQDDTPAPDQPLSLSSLVDYLLAWTEPSLDFSCCSSSSSLDTARSNDHSFIMGCAPSYPSSYSSQIPPYSSSSPTSVMIVKKKQHFAAPSPTDTTTTTTTTCSDCWDSTRMEEQDQLPSSPRIVGTFSSASLAQQQGDDWRQEPVATQDEVRVPTRSIVSHAPLTCRVRTEQQSTAAALTIQAAFRRRCPPPASTPPATMIQIAAVLAMQRVVRRRRQQQPYEIRSTAAIIDTQEEEEDALSSSTTTTTALHPNISPTIWTTEQATDVQVLPQQWRRTLAAQRGRCNNTPLLVDTTLPRMRQVHPCHYHQGEGQLGSHVLSCQRKVEYASSSSLRQLANEQQGAIQQQLPQQQQTSSPRRLQKNQLQLYEDSTHNNKDTTTTNTSSSELGNSRRCLLLLSQQVVALQQQLAQTTQLQHLEQQQTNSNVVVSNQVVEMPTMLLAARQGTKREKRLMERTQAAEPQALLLFGQGQYCYGSSNNDDGQANELQAKKIADLQQQLAEHDIRKLQVMALEHQVADLQYQLKNSVSEARCRLEEQQQVKKQVVEAMQRKLDQAEARLVVADEREAARTAGKENTNQTINNDTGGEQHSTGLSSKQQESLMSESGKMLEYLRKQVLKLRTQHKQLNADYDTLKVTNRRLVEANADAGASFATLNQHTKELAKSRDKLATELAQSKRAVRQWQVTLAEAREEGKLKQSTYASEVRARLLYQKSLWAMVDLVQDQCRDTKLVEKLLRVADHCEREQAAHHPVV
jgi:hypothetical protein